MKDQREPTPDEWVETLFARNLLDLRSQSGITQAKLAEKLTALGFKVDPLTILRMEKNSGLDSMARRIRLGEAALIAQVLNVPLEQMIREPSEIERELVETEERLAQTREEKIITQQRLQTLLEYEKDLYRRVRKLRGGLSAQERHSQVKSHLESLRDKQEALRLELSELEDPHSTSRRVLDDTEALSTIEQLSRDITILDGHIREARMELQRWSLQFRPGDD